MTSNRLVPIAVGFLMPLATSWPMFAVPSSQAKESARILKRDIPKEFAPAHGFLELIKFPSEPQTGFNPRHTPNWDQASFMSFISARGVVFTDVNDASKVSRSFEQIKAAIQSRTGNTFRTFAHLAHIYSNPYKQYSELSFSKIPNGQIITLSYGYNLTFQFEGGKPKLVRCDFTAEEGC